MENLRSSSSERLAPLVQPDVDVRHLGCSTVFPTLVGFSNEMILSKTYPKQSACTTVWSDPFDVDGDGDFNNGWPYCYSSKGFVFYNGVSSVDVYERCGLCSCVAGEEQRWQTYQFPSDTPIFSASVSYLSCAPCTAGRFREVGGVVGEESACSPCAGGSTSVAGATAPPERVLLVARCVFLVHVPLRLGARLAVLAGLQQWRVRLLAHRVPRDAQACLRVFRLVFGTHFACGERRHGHVHQPRSFFGVYQMW